MVKDRFGELQDNIQRYSDGFDLNVISRFTTIDMEAPTFDEFFNQIEIIRNSNEILIELIERVNKIQDEILVSAFIDGLKQTLDCKTTEIKTLGRQTRMKINQLKNTIEMPNSRNVISVQQRIVSSQIDMITKQFCQIMNKYYQSTIVYREKYKQRIQRQLQIVQGEQTNEEIEELMKNDFLSMFPDIALETRHSKEKLDEMISRHQQLLELEEKIQEIHEIFFDMSYIVTAADEQMTYINEKTRDAAEHVDFIDNYVSAIKIPNQFCTNKIIGYIIIIIICCSFIIYFIIKLFMLF